MLSLSVFRCRWLVIETGSDVTIRGSTREKLQGELPKPFMNQARVYRLLQSANGFACASFDPLDTKQPVERTTVAK